MRGRQERKLLLFLKCEAERNVLGVRDGVIPKTEILGSPLPMAGGFARAAWHQIQIHVYTHCFLMASSSL